MRVVADIEADGLLDTVSRIWCIVCKDIDTHTVYSFIEDEITNGKFVEFAKNVSTWIGHNFIAYDHAVIERCVGYRIDPSSVVDTLIMSQLWWQGRPDGHSLESWGDALKYPKIHFDDWSKFTQEMLTYCINDVELNHKVYDTLVRKTEGWGYSLDLEHKMAWICRGMHDDGFAFDYSGAKQLEQELVRNLTAIDLSIEQEFPDKLTPIRVVTPRLTKFGTISKVGLGWHEGSDYTIFSANSPFTLCERVRFNPGSPKQVIERLNEFGWQPVDKTKGHIKAEKERDKTKLEKFKTYGWMLNERNFASLPASAPPAASLLVKRGLIAARLRTLTEWFGSYNPNTGRIHGTFNTLGTWTHRLSHVRPNLGNVAAAKSIKYNSEELKTLATDLGGRMRAFWRAQDYGYIGDSDSSHLVSADMDAAHLRIFAHLIQDKALAEAIDAGDKSKGTDVHTINMLKLGGICQDRDRSKTFIYTFLNGGGVGKVASIFGCSLDEARYGLDAFITSYPGLARLKKDILPAWAERGFFVGLDGRKVACDSAHAMMAGILQNYEAVLMKEANILWRKKADEVGYRYKQVNLVHDEFVTEVRGDRGIAMALGELQAQCITEVGVRHNLICPLRSSPAVGKTWLEIH